MLDKSILNIKGIGQKRAKILKDESSIETIEDLLYYTPRRYIDRSTFKSIKDCFLNEIVSVTGIIENIKISGNRKKFLEVEINDGTDSLKGLFFGGVKIFQNIFKIKDSVIFSGKIQFFKSKQIVHPEFDFFDENSSIQLLNTGRIIPLYRSSEKLKTAGLDSRGFRRIIKQIIDNYLDHITESLGKPVLLKYNLLGIKEALFAIHFPETFDQAEDARRRLAFNEIFFLQYYLNLSRKYVREMFTRKRVILNSQLIEKFFYAIPFDLTADQKKSIEEIKNDLLSDYPMNRLLQGDVGSGKTVVSMAASVISVSMGYQVAVMAPTEVLAVQHYENFNKILPGSISISLLIGSHSKNEKEIIYRGLKDKKIDIIIGTHALIQESVEFNSLGLIIIDEQQKFGVEQRSKLRSKGNDTDLLIMTATPIPRSLTMTLYGDLDVSQLKMKPANRIRIKTLAFPVSKVKSVYNSLEKYISLGRQIYYVLPLIEESEKVDLKSAIEVFKNLKENIFPNRTIDLIHGRMKHEKKDSIMKKFKNGGIDILVSTTVIEVGIDVPNANVIVVEHAERFGLSQLHQLRGRIGRGDHESFCVLMYPDDIGSESIKRIETLVDCDDGFQISEEDLKLRGAGQLIGTRQHGHSGSFEFIDLIEDSQMILDARNEAIKAISEITDYPAVFNDMENSNLKIFQNGIRIKKILSILS